MKFNLKVLSLVSIVLALSAGCKKEEAEPAKPAPADPTRVASVEERMADKEYVAKLDAQRDEQKRLAAQAAAAKTDEERKAAAEALEANRQKTMQLIRDRMKQ